MFTEETSEEREPHFDCRDALAAVEGTGIVCPDIDNQLMRTYFGFFIRSGFLPGPGVNDTAEGAPHPTTMHRRDIHETSA